MSKAKETRTIYKKDLTLSKLGFSKMEEAEKVKAAMAALYREPKYRVRCRLRSRTNTWDVVVKVATEVTP